LQCKTNNSNNFTTIQENSKQSFARKMFFKVSLDIASKSCLLSFIYVEVLEEKTTFLLMNTYNLKYISIQLKECKLIVSVVLHSF